MKKILREMMKDKTFNSEIKNKLGNFLIKHNNIFQPNLLYSSYLNYKDLVKLLEISNISKEDKELMIKNFISSKFIDDDEKDKIMYKLKDFNINDRFLKKIFDSENLSIEIKRKYLKQLLPNENIYNYAWNEEIPITWIEKDFKDISEKDVFNELLSKKITKIPSDIIKLDYLIDILNIENIEEDKLTEIQKKIKLNNYYLKDDIIKILFQLPFEEIKKFLNFNITKQKQIIDSDNLLFNFYNYISRTHKNIKETDINNSVPIEYKLLLLKFNKNQIKKILNEEITNYFKINSENEKIKILKSKIIKAIILKHDFINVLFKDYKDKINNIDMLIYMEHKNKLSSSERDRYIKEYKNEDILSIFFNGNNEFSDDEIKFYFENNYINEKNMYFLSNFIHTNYEKVFEPFINGKNGKYIFENQKLSKKFLKTHLNVYNNKDNRNFYETIKNQENLPIEFINELKNKDMETYLLTNTNYMFDKNIDDYKEKLLNLLQNKVAGGIKFDAILGYIISDILKIHNMRIEIKNSSPKLISNEEYTKKYTNLNVIENNDIKINL